MTLTSKRQHFYGLLYQNADIAFFPNTSCVSSVAMAIATVKDSVPAVHLALLQTLFFSPPFVDQDVYWTFCVVRASEVFRPSWSHWSFTTQSSTHS